MKKIEITFRSLFLIIFLLQLKQVTNSPPVMTHAAQKAINSAVRYTNTSQSGPKYLHYDSNICLDVSNACVNLDLVSHQCLNCKYGFYINNGQCIEVKCPSNQIPSKYGSECVDKSPLCLQYDHLAGDCLICVKNSKLSNGDCLQAVQPLASCKNRQALEDGQCVNATNNCKIYDLVNLKCIQCNKGYFHDPSGKCVAETARCRSDEVSIHGVCHQRSANCLKFDLIGLCIQCSSSNYQIIQGQCVLFQKCKSNQLQINGKCIDLTENCQVANPDTGMCIKCEDGKSAINGLCCINGQTVYQGKCHSISKVAQLLSPGQKSKIPTCLIYHPSMGYCLQCNPGFSVDMSTMTTCK